MLAGLHLSFVLPPPAAASAAPADAADDATEAVSFSDLPNEVLLTITAILLPPNGLADEPMLWRGAMAFGACSSVCGAYLAEACQVAFPAFAGLHTDSPAAWGALLGGLHAGGCGRWLPCSPMRAVRPQQPQRQPVQAPPHLSGASMCALAPNLLCVFGGRSSVSAETRGTTYLVTIARSGAERAVALWDELQTGESPPPPRCYHTAQMWTDHSAPLEQSPMVVFGGAGEDEGMFNCAWKLERVGRDGFSSAPWRWRQLVPSGELPAARSSHLCVNWSTEGALVVHGGLGNDGVTGDVWMLRRGDGGNGVSGGECAWARVITSGGDVKRAHHAGGLVRESLLVYSGQDERLLTVHNLASLCLSTATWSLVSLPSDYPASPMPPHAVDLSEPNGAQEMGDDEPTEADASASMRTFTSDSDGGRWGPADDGDGGRGWGGFFRCGDSNAGGLSPLARIDGAATTIEGVGILVFGGVKADFNFVPPSNTWLLKGAHDARHNQPAASQFTQAPKARACLGLCSDGLRVYSFGGFDGEHDLDDLWCLSLMPPVFASAAASTDGGAVAPASASDGVAQVPRYGRTPEEMVKAIEEADTIKARRAKQALVVHASGSPYGGSTGLSIHLRVFQAGQVALPGS